MTIFSVNKSIIPGLHKDSIVYHPTWVNLLNLQSSHFYKDLYVLIIGIQCLVKLLTLSLLKALLPLMK